MIGACHSWTDTTKIFISAFLEEGSRGPSLARPILLQASCWACWTVEWHRFHLRQSEHAWLHLCVDSVCAQYHERHLVLSTASRSDSWPIQQLSVKVVVMFGGSGQLVCEAEVWPANITWLSNGTDTERVAARTVQARSSPTTSMGLELPFLFFFDTNTLPSAARAPRDRSHAKANLLFDHPGETCTPSRPKSPRSCHTASYSRQRKSVLETTLNNMFFISSHIYSNECSPSCSRQL